MRDPARLLSGEADDFEKELLGSWSAEQPSDAGRARVLAMAGLGVSAAAAGAATKAGAVAGGSVAPKAAAAGAAVVVKWLAVGGLGLAMVGAGVGLVRHRRSASDRAPAASYTAAPAADAAPLPLLSPSAAAPSPGVPLAEEAPRAAPPSTTPRRSPATDHPARSTDASLGEQVASLDRARRALGDGDGATALRQIADYEARFPDGALIEEAEVLRVESLLAAGDRASAARAGSRFLNAHPESPHAAHVRRALLGASPPP